MDQVTPPGTGGGSQARATARSASTRSQKHSPLRAHRHRFDVVSSLRIGLPAESPVATFALATADQWKLSSMTPQWQDQVTWDNCQAGTQESDNVPGTSSTLAAGKNQW